MVILLSDVPEEVEPGSLMEMLNQYYPISKIERSARLSPVARTARGGRWNGKLNWEILIGKWRTLLPTRSMVPIGRGITSMPIVRYSSNYPAFPVSALLT